MKLDSGRRGNESPSKLLERKNIVLFLIKQGANVEGVEIEGATASQNLFAKPLFLAIRINDYSIVKSLLHKGAKYQLDISSGTQGLGAYSPSYLFTALEEGETELQKDSRRGDLSLETPYYGAARAIIRFNPEILDGTRYTNKFIRFPRISNEGNITLGNVHVTHLSEAHLAVQSIREINAIIARPDRRNVDEVELTEEQVSFANLANQVLSHPVYGGPMLKALTNFKD